MFNILLAVASIDYEATFRTMFPFILQKARAHSAGHFLVRLLADLGEDAQPVLLGLIRQISGPARDELFCQCMNVYGSTLTAGLNGFLEKDSWGKNFSMGHVHAVRQDSGLLVVAENVQANFRELLGSDAVKSRVESAVSGLAGQGIWGRLAGKVAQGALQAVTEINPADLESAGAALLNRDMVQSRLLEIAGRALVDRGVHVSLSGLEIVPGPAGTAEAYTGRLLPPELETAVIHAISEYLRRTVAQGSAPA